MATACLLNGDLEGGAEAIGLVLAQSALARNASLVGRLARTRTALEASAWAANARARQLADDIGEWLAAGKEPRAP
jgi:hypothetical protein